MSSSPTLSIIIVSWNVRDLLRVCLHSIQRAQGQLALEVIVVDSASADGSADMVRAEFPHVRLMACETNVGFSKGNNLGFAAAQGEYLLCLNPDTEIVGAALQQMVTHLQTHPEIGVVGPQLRYPDGSVQSSRRRFPTLATGFFEGTLLEQWFPRNRFASRYRMSDQSDDVAQEVDWLVGAAFLLRREIYRQTGGFDESFFMYSEELDWHKRIKANGWRIVYLPTAQIAHHENRSSDQTGALRYIRFHTSKLRYFRKHHGRVAAETLRWFLLATYVYQIIAEAGKWLVGHKRALRGPRIKAHWQVLRSGLSN